MIPFMYSHIVKLVRCLMQIVVKHDRDGCMSGQDLRKIYLDKENVFMKKKEFNRGFTAENKRKVLQRRDFVKREAVANFLNNVLLPIVSVVVRNASVFNPDSIFGAKMRIFFKI